MSRPLYKDLETLKAKCEQYFKSTTLVAPRAFRVYIGVSKSLLSKWQINKPEYFNLIKSYEGRILAFIEEVAIYGATHPVINKVKTKTQTGKGGTTTETKFNQIGAMFILKAYDNELYNQLPPQERVEQRAEPIVIDTTNKSKLNLGELIEVKAEEK